MGKRMKKISAKCKTLWAKFKALYMKRLWLSITITVAVVAITATSITVWTMISNVDEKAEMFADRVADNISDKAKVEEIKAEMDSYYATLPGWLKDRFNKHMEEYINSTGSGNVLKKAKTVEEIIEGIEKHCKEHLSIQQLPAFVAELENLIVVLPTEEGKKAKSENEKINEVIKEYNDDLGSKEDEQMFIEELRKLIETLKSEGENEGAQELKGKITGFLNSLVEFFLTDEENAIFKVKLGEYVQAIKAGKPESVKMDGNFSQVVEYYNDLSAEDKALFVEVVEEYIK